MDERRGLKPDASSDTHAVRRNSALAHGTEPQPQESPPRARSPQQLHFSSSAPARAPSLAKPKKLDHTGVPTDRQRLGEAETPMREGSGRESRPSRPTAADVRRAESPHWKERPSYEYMLDKRAEMEERQGKKASDKAKKEVLKTVGPFAETIKEKDSKTHEVRFGKIRFEENGRVVPYLIVPERMRDSAELREIIVKHMKHVTPSTGPEGRPLSKPSTIFDISSGGKSYLEVSKQPVSLFLFVWLC